MNPEKKWICEYCTYENFPNALKCTMCRGARPLRSTDEIYRLKPEESCKSGAAESDARRWVCDTCGHANGSDGKKCSSCSSRSPLSSMNQVATANLAEQLQKTRITDCSSASTRTSLSPPQQQPCGKWSCAVCTYENWPKSKKCIMCGTTVQSSPAQRLSPSRSNNATFVSAARQPSPERIVDYTFNEESALIKSPCNNYEYDTRKKEVDWTWLNACKGVVDGDPAPVAAYLTSGGSPTRTLTPIEVQILSRDSAFDVGHTLVHLAIRFQREDMVAMLVSSIDGGGSSGLKRVPSYIAPELARSIRRHATTIFNTKHSRPVPFPFVTEFTTFVLPTEIEDLPASVQEQLFSELLDKDVQQQLEMDPAVINWSVEITMQLGSRLHALWNRSQGDCLLDSLMQATWGVCDRDSLLRRALADSLSHGAHLLYPRWLESEAVQARQLEFTLSEAQWAEDWAALVKRATTPGASLQQLHVFALAHVLRRPIIVYGVKFVKSFRGEDLGYAGFEGVYLPLLWEPSFCTVSPLALGYTRGHFSALVSIETATPVLARPSTEKSKTIVALDDNISSVCHLPLVDKDRKLLPIHFLTKQEMGTEERLLRRWLDVSVTDGGLLVALQRSPRPPLLVAQMLEEWLNHYRSLALMSRTPYSNSVPPHEFSSDGETDDE
ncbi:OTU-like cysteine protease [Nesidiocoris tenuis]|uniref:ubiquitinyl hydrolase 1 n=1 Tax=Nesidiocoris tenuis TaxID=355587 RepID=A0ABN7AZ31_9HEMI|nr:OTU-like cysteine protease [Nesidiocoris tenuis]